MIRITDPKDCCGCSACYSICPHQAIGMEPDVLGFLYPKVNLDKCTDCGLCEKVCAFNDHYDTHLNLDRPVAFAMRHKNMQEMAKSQSGGAFPVLSDIFLAQGGVVYGVGYGENFRAIHKRATTREERDEFRGSKYVQSDMGDIFRQVREDLKAGRKVLFTGTPCQTAGLSSYIGKKWRENLYLVDIICHGVPGPYLWRDYVNYVQKKEGRPIYMANFRDKKFGWKSKLTESFVFQNPYKYKAARLYSFIFLQCTSFRYSCHVCYYANLQRPSDITIGDYWGFERTDPAFNKDNKGCSLVLCNTSKGLELFNSIKQDILYLDVKLEDCLQPNLQQPTKMNPERKQFEDDYAHKSFDYILKRYMDSPRGWWHWKRVGKKFYRKQKKKLKNFFTRHTLHQMN